MPFSSSAFDYYIRTVIDLLEPETVCDIGPGAGKYGHIVRASATQRNFSTKITAIEIDESYVQQYQLNRIYDEVIVGDAIEMIHSPRRRFDLVIIGDCIEHMRKSSGVDLLNFLIYRCGYICVVYPDSYMQDDWEGHVAEAHISTWAESDFKGWDVLHHSWGGMHLFLIKGLLPSRLRITG